MSVSAPDAQRARPRLRVLQVTPYFAPAFGFGGPPRSILALSQSLLAAGMAVEVLTTTAHPERQLPVAVEGTLFEGVPVRYFPLTPPQRLLGSLALHRMLSRLANQADIIHVHGLFNATSWSAAHVARRRRRVLVVSARGMLSPAALRHHPRRKRAAWALFDRRSARRATLLHCTSEQEACDAARLGLTRTVTIPNPVTPAATVAGAEQDAVRRALHLPPSGRLVLFLGRAHPIKRLDLLAQAFARVAAVLPDVHLVVAGAASEATRLAVRRHAAPASARVHLPGPVVDHARDALLNAASVLVSCSDSESFGMSIAEALSAGVPVVATQTCPWEAIERAGAGRWVPQDITSLTAGMLDVLSETARAGTMSQKARALAASQFGPASVARQWATAYADCLVRHAAGSSAA